MSKLFDEEVAQWSSMLGGIFLRKAELSGDFTAVYSTIFERIDSLQTVEGDAFLAVLGEVGG